MPLVRYEIKSEHSLANPDLFRSSKEPEGLLEGVAVAGLVGIVRQIGDLAEFAADIFRDLHEEVLAVASRGHDVAIRVQQIEAEMPSIEKALLSETNQLKFAYNRGTEWHASIRTDQNHCTQGDLPRFVRNSYEECRGPPRLSLLDRFDVGGAGACLKRYTDPSFFRTEWAKSELSKAEQAQRDNKARRGKRKGRRRKGSNESVDSIPVTQINSRIRYSSRGVETDAASGSSSSLNSEYVGKQALPPNWRADSGGGSGSSSSKDSRAPLSIVQGQDAGDAPRSLAAVSTALLKQPRVALPPSRVLDSPGSGSGSPSSLSSAEHLSKQPRDTLPPGQQAGTSGAASVQQIVAQPNEVLEHSEVVVPGAGTAATRQASDFEHSTPVIEEDEPLKLSAKDIEAESLSSRFVRAQQKANLETVQEHAAEELEYHLSDERVQIYPIPVLDEQQATSEQSPEPLQAQLVPSQQGPTLEPTSDNHGASGFKATAEPLEGQALLPPRLLSLHSAAEPHDITDLKRTAEPPQGAQVLSQLVDSEQPTDRVIGLEQTRAEEQVEDVTGETENFVDALATMESDGETDADTRTSESRPRPDVDFDEDEVQSKFVTDQPASNKNGENAEELASEALVSPAPPVTPTSSRDVGGPTPRSAELQLPGQDVETGGDNASPTESTARFSLRTVDSAELISPTESSTGLSSPGTFPDSVVTPRGMDASVDDVAYTSAGETSSGLPPVGQVTSPFRESYSSLKLGDSVLRATPEEVVRVTTESPSESPSSDGVSLQEDPVVVCPPSTSESSATPSFTARPAEHLVIHTASASEGDTGASAPDPPSPTGTVIVHSSPKVVGRAPWDLVSPAGSALSTPRVAQGNSHELASPGGSTSDTSSLYKVQSPPTLYFGQGKLAVPAEDLPSLSMSLPSIGKESPPGAHAGGSSSGENGGQTTNSELVTTVLADDLVPAAEVEDDHSLEENSGEVTSVPNTTTIGHRVEEVNSIRTGPQAGSGENPLSPTEESGYKELAGENPTAENSATHPQTPPKPLAEVGKDGKAETRESERIPTDPLLHLLSSEEEPEDELDEELVVAAGSRNLSPTPISLSLPNPPSPPSPDSPPSSPSPRAPRFFVLDPLSLSDTEAKDPESSPRGSDGSSPRSSVFSALHSPMSPPLQSRKLLKSPEATWGRSFRASEVVAPVSPTRGSRPLPPRSSARPEMLPLLPPLNPGQWQGVSAYHERRHSLPVEFGRSPSRVPAPPALPLLRDLQSPLTTAPMPTRRAPVPGQQSVIDAVAAHDRSKLKTVPPSLQSSSKLPFSSDREVMLQQIRTQSFNLRDTKSVPRVKSESPQRPVTNINVAAILEKANAIRQAFTSSDEDDEDDDQWSEK